ncbi:MAG: bifunctional phosphoribosyl-AMP cyclohydrolase/phosphoribosyl-ATP diphosphatase HisIE [Acholeplasmatales bacterium]|nr:MAG: bifunctional phosphoribosyl-AMP cyclohydrolase/phosphoribosyl-ATP diphosphatase HisIE [Acholeplasmatales bacterium]
MENRLIENTIERLRFDAAGLVTAVAVEAETQTVLMVAHMDAMAVRETLRSGYAHYFSRSRQKLWKKGETSGHVQKVVGFALDCDQDAVLLQVEQTGVACHTLQKSCFHDAVIPAENIGSPHLLDTLYAIIEDRKAHPEAGSYTGYLFEKGLDKMLKKVGEEAAEVIIAAKNQDTAPLEEEIADLLYHLFVVMVERGVRPADVFGVLAARRGTRRERS